MMILKVVVVLCFVAGSYGIKPIIEIPRDFRVSDVDSLLATYSRQDLKDGSDCSRRCVVGDSPRVCYYEFNVEHYHVMGTACGRCGQGVIADCLLPQCLPVDGIERGAITINRRIPGPLIEVCQNDMIVVDVLNKMPSDSFSVHWHGINQQGTPYMDGVPFVTQCPIHPGNNFRYAYEARDAGTNFYHSHSGMQRYNGAYGGLIVRTPTDPNSSEYDEDVHTVILTEWSHEAPEMFMVGLPNRAPGMLPQGALINGKGRFSTNPATQPFTNVPYENLYVSRGKRYRLRIISAGSTPCPMSFQIQNHTMTIIATDGANVVPVDVNTLTIGTGERYDVVVDANQPAGLYWMHLKVLGPCVSRAIFQTAVLSYIPNSGATHQIPSSARSYAGYPNGVMFNELNTPCSDADNICLSELQSQEVSDLWTRPVDQKFYIPYGMIELNMTRFYEREAYTPFINTGGQSISLGTINGLSFIPQSSPLLTQLDRIDPESFCDVNKLPRHCDDMEVCTCTQVLDLEQNAVVEIILIDTHEVPDPVPHPMHFHGYKFVVTSEGQFHDIPGALDVDRIKDLEEAGLLEGNNTRPVFKDAVIVRTKGFVTLRLVADNPGLWMMHCHIEDHMMYGMAIVLRVAGSLPPAPLNFPKCGHFP